MFYLVGTPLLVLVVGIVLLVTVLHAVLSLPFWLVVGAIAAYLWYRGGARRHWLGRGRMSAGYLPRRARW